MDNVVPVAASKEDLPEGFTVADPNATPQQQQKNSEAEAKEMQKQAILEQAMTPDALARLSRIKVRCFVCVNEKNERHGRNGHD